MFRVPRKKESINNKEKLSLAIEELEKAMVCLDAELKKTSTPKFFVQRVINKIYTLEDIVRDNPRIYVDHRQYKQLNEIIDSTIISVTKLEDKLAEKINTSSQRLWQKIEEPPRRDEQKTARA